MAFDILVSSVTHSRSALRSSHFPHPGLGLKLLRSLLTSRSGTGRQAFTHKARSPRVRTHSFAAQPPDLRHRSLDHKSFAVSCPLALPGSAFYPVLVHRLAASLYASSPRSVALTQLRFASFAVINSREDLHLQECARAGRTRQMPRCAGTGAFSTLPTRPSARAKPEERSGRLNAAALHAYCSSDSTICGCWLAWASMAVAACCTIWARASSVVALA